MRFRKKSDANTKEVAAALRKAGASVYHLGDVGKGVPDLLVGYKSTTFLIEVKNRATHARKSKADGDGLHTPDQERFVQTWQGRPAVTVYGVEDALRAIGARAKLPPRQAREEKVRWLAARPELWSDISGDVLAGLYWRGRDRYRRIARQMKAEGLFSASTGLIDMRLGQLILEAKALACVDATPPARERAHSALTESAGS